jgi:menaquinone-dependent protoporphyrinogen oxidase
MQTLIAVASRHGSTREIAQAIAGELVASELAVDVRDAGDVESIDPYDAVILGSAVYMGSWLPEARAFVDRYQPRLAAVPVWLFSSGPIGAGDPQPPGDPGQLPELIQATGAREHRIFSGKIDKRRLGFGERLAIKLVRAPEGDFRDWEAIRAWAREIAAALRPSGVAR